jgi:hypothetical protein
MKVEIEKNEELDIQGQRSGRQASFSQNKGLIFSLLENQYSRKEGAIVRELGTNARDAHVNAKVKRPIKIGFDYDDNGNQYFYVKDYGCGMNYDFIYDTYMDYGESTKTGNDDEAGMFGIGSKSPYTLFEQYYIISNVDGIKYHYVFFKSDDMIPDFEVLDKRETTDLNGTEVRMFITDIKKDEYFYKSSFIEAFKRELMYFPEVLYSETGDDEDLMNYKIYEFDNFYIRNDYQGYANVSNAGVCYPINDNVLKLTKQLPIGLKFKTGELRVQPSRESIRDDIKEIKAIRNKFKASCYELINKWNSHDNFNILDLNEYLSKVNNSIYKIKDVEIDIVNVKTLLSKNFNIEYKLKRYKFRLFEDLDINSYSYSDIENIFSNMFTIIGSIYNGRYSSLNKNLPNKYSIVDELINSNNNSIYITTDETFKKDIQKNKFINNGTVIVINKKYLNFIKSLYGLFRRNRIEFFRFRKARLIYIFFENYILTNTQSYDDLELPENVNIALKFNDSFTANTIKGRKSYNNVKDFVDTFYSGNKRKTVYFNNKKLRDVFFALTRYERRFNFIYLSKTNYSILKQYNGINNKRFMSQEELFQHRTFKDVCTAFYLKAALEHHKKNKEVYTNFYSDKLLFICNSDIYNKYAELLRYIKSHTAFIYASIDSEIKDEFIQDCISLAKKNNYINKDRFNTLKEIRNYFKGLELLTYIDIDQLETPEEQQEVVNYIISQKKRVDKKWYNILNNTWEVQFIKENYEKFNYLKSINKLAA